MSFEEEFPSLKVYNRPRYTIDPVVKELIKEHFLDKNKVEKMLVKIYNKMHKIVGIALNTTSLTKKEIDGMLGGLDEFRNEMRKELGL